MIALRMRLWRKGGPSKIGLALELLSEAVEKSGVTPVVQKDGGDVPFAIQPKTYIQRSDGLLTLDDQTLSHFAVPTCRTSIAP